MRRIDKEEFARARTCFRIRLEAVIDAGDSHIELMPGKNCHDDIKKLKYCIVVYFPMSNVLNV